MSIPALGGAALSAFGNAGTQAATDFSMKSLMDLFGSEMFSNLIKGGTGLYQGKQMGDMLDFQKDQAKIANARQDQYFADYQSDRDFRKNLDFKYDYENNVDV